MDKEARKEITEKLSDRAILELNDMLNAQYRAGYNYAEFRREQSAKYGVPEKTADEVLAVVLKTKCDPIYFRALIRGA